MTDRQNPGRDAFIQARARGLNSADAHVAAGYTRCRAAAGRVAKRPEVEARLAQLLIPRQALREARVEETILALLAMAEVAGLKSGAGIREARAARLEAHRLSSSLSRRPPAEPWEPPRPMTEEEWEAKYGPDAPTPTD
jgi:hypothetical protein